MTQADGFTVDCGALEEIAGRAGAVAPEAGTALAEARDAFANTVNGAPGLQTAKVAEPVHRIWGSWLADRTRKIEEIARKLDETCADYRATDEGIGSVFDRVGRLPGESPGIPGVPGGGYIPPHMGPDLRPDGGGGGIPGAPGGGYIPPHMDPD